MSAATDTALPRIKLDEGCKLAAYPDPLSGGDPWTIGYGCTEDGIAEGTVWTQAQADAEVQTRVENLDSGLAKQYSWYSEKDPVRQAVLICMEYQLGASGLSAFKQTLSYVASNQFTLASTEMLDSTWAKQTPGRAERLSNWMQTGIASY